MTDKTPTDKPEEKGKNSAARTAAIGAAATIGSAAVAAALLYAGKRFRKKPDDSAIGSDQAATPPSGEPPETD
ncbi:MAG: isopropylmalate isomerase [Erythrobacter sp.]|uniref:isopropylmalate isomerase n=1 Tax=Erythrobacter sp. Alg231-14 TaxID=1922225 RepID=UPI000D54F975